MGIIVCIILEGNLFGMKKLVRTDMTHSGSVCTEITEAE